MVSFDEFKKLLRDNRLLILAVFLSCVALAATYTFTQTPQYSATTLLYISSIDQNGDPTKAYQGNLLSEQKVDSYVNLVRSDRIRLDASSRLGSPIDEGAISSYAQPSTVLLTISATDPSPERAAGIADAAADSFVALVSQLERPSNPNLPPTVRANVVQKALVPVDPASPNNVRNLGLGIALGVLLGLIAAVTRSALDTYVRTTQQLEMASGVPVIGDVQRWSPSASPLPVRDRALSPVAEEFNRIRTNLTFLRSGGGGNAIAVTSSSPGEGKSTTAANIAIALARAGEHVLLVDADLRRPQIAQIFSLEGAVGLTTVLTERIELERAVSKLATNLHVLPSGQVPPNPNELLSSDSMARFFELAHHNYSYVVLDCPPLLPVADAATIATQVTNVLLVCRSGETKTAQIERALKLLSAVQSKPSASILTFSRRSQSELSYGSYYGGDSVESEGGSNTQERSEVTDTIPASSRRKPSPTARPVTRTSSMPADSNTGGR